MSNTLATVTYLNKHKNNKTHMNCFLEKGAMLSGKITDFDSDCIILDDCLIFIQQIISITPAKTR